MAPDDSLEQWIKDFEAKIELLESERDSWKAKYAKLTKSKGFLARRENLRYKLMAEEQQRIVAVAQRDQLEDRWEHLRFHIVSEEWPDEVSRGIAFGIVELMLDIEENDEHQAVCNYGPVHPGVPDYEPEPKKGRKE